MKSYFKSQWLDLVIGLIYIGVSIYYFCKDNALWAIGYLLVASVWLIMSRVNYNDERLKQLEAKARKYDALVEEVSALYEANRIDREHMKLLEQKINQLKYDLEERR